MAVIENCWGKVSSWEPVSKLRHVPIKECGEPLVDFLTLCPELVWEKPRWQYQRVHLLRQTVAEKLCEAARSLPRGYRLAVIEGWRPLHIQRRMFLTAMKRWREAHPDWSEPQVRRLASRFTAPPDHRVPPPHTTGGAVDVLLADGEGNVLDLISPYKPRDRRAYPFSAKGLTETARKHREILREALASVGLTNYPSEFWHYSYGDQGWAYRGGHPYAIYGMVIPPGYSPPPEDVTEEPLQWIGPE